jgi:hypothetical protein
MQENLMKRLSAVALILFAAGAAAASGVEVREEFHNTYNLSATGGVRVANVNGAIRISAWDRNEVKVDAVKRGRSQQALDDAKIVVDAGAAAIEIRTEYPEDCHDGATVDYTITVPRRAELTKISAVNGRVEIDGVSGRVHASTVNGRVVLRGAENGADLKSTNGQIDAEFAGLGTGVSAQTVNGGILLALPKNAGAHLTAKTVHGGIHSAFDLPVRRMGFRPGAHVDATVGGGGPEVQLSTVNGGIDLR